MQILQHLAPTLASVFPSRPHTLGCVWELYGVSVCLSAIAGAGLGFDFADVWIDMVTGGWMCAMAHIESIGEIQRLLPGLQPHPGRACQQHHPHSFGAGAIRELGEAQYSEDSPQRDNPVKAGPRPCEPRERGLKRLRWRL